MKWFRKYEKPKIEDLGRIEEIYETSLPEDYKKFLVNIGGGVPEDSCFYIGKETAKVFVIFSVNGEENDIFEEIDAFNAMGFSGYLPVGRDDAAERICLSMCEGEAFGCVFVTEGYHDRENQIDFHRVAPSFDSFLSGLFVSPALAERDNEVYHLARKGAAQELAKFLKKGGSVNACAFKNKTLIQVAAGAGNVALVSELLKHGADLSLSLHMALMNSRLECVKVLVAGGADVDEADVDGFRPIDLVATLQNAEDRLNMRQLLREHGAKG